VICITKQARTSPQTRGLSLHAKLIEPYQSGRCATVGSMGFCHRLPFAFLVFSSLTACTETPMAVFADSSTGESESEEGGRRRRNRGDDSAADPSGVASTGMADPNGSDTAEDPTIGMDTAASPPVVMGIEVDGVCHPICMGDVSADAEGDDWGWENNESCVYSGTATFGGGTPCSLGPAIPDEPFVPPPPGEAEKPETIASTGFFVLDGRLYDRYGYDFVMRGINYPHFWFLGEYGTALADIAATGANTVRLVWETQTYQGQSQADALAALRAGIEETIALEMVPMVELHDVTGNTENARLLDMAEYYAQDAVRTILLDYEDYLLVNIANEWSGNDWVGGYQAAIRTLRDAGINHTLVIDSNGYGQNYRTILDGGQELLDFDPQHNLLFSVHMYQSFERGTDVTAALQGAAQAQLPIIVGEFGFQHGTPVTQVAWETILSESERLQTGYLAWSWTGNSDDVGYLDMVTDFGGGFTAWGLDVVDGTNGIRATADVSLVFGAN